MWGWKDVKMQVSQMIQIILSKCLSVVPELPLAGFTKTSTTALQLHSYGSFQCLNPLQVIITTHLSHNSLLFFTSAGPYTPHSTDVSPWTNLAEPSALSSSPSSQLISFNLAIFQLGKGSALVRLACNITAVPELYKTHVG